MDYGVCRSCSAQIVWAKAAKTGKPIPLDPEPNEERGNVLVDGQGRAFAFRNAAAVRAYQEGNPESELAGSCKHMPHHATCPHGKAWQGKQRGDADAPDQAALL